MNFRKKTRNTKKRGNPLWLKIKGNIRLISYSIFGGVFSLFCILSVWHLYDWLLTSPYFIIKEIEVGGNTKLSKTEILEIAGVNVGDNLFAIDADDIENGIISNPWIYEVKVERGFPDRLSIKIKERKPIAFINLDVLCFVDETGTIFKRTSLGDDIDLPMITGLKREDINEEGRIYELSIKAINLLHLLAKRETDNYAANSNQPFFELGNLSEINVDKDYGITLYTMQEGTRIELGDMDFIEGLERLDNIIKAKNGLSEIEFIGLNYKNGVVVRLNSKEHRV